MEGKLYFSGFECEHKVSQGTGILFQFSANVLRKMSSYLREHNTFANEHECFAKEHKVTQGYRILLQMNTNVL